MGQTVDAFVRDIPEIENPLYLIEMLQGAEKKYYQDKRKELIDQGFLSGASLEQYLYGAILHRRYTIAEEMIYNKAKKEGVAESLQINRDSMTKLSQLASNNQKLYDTMVKAKIEAEKQKEISDLHGEVMDNMEQYIKEHIGEFSFRCKTCGNLVHTDGLPIEGVLSEKNNEGERIYYVWNPHLEFMVLKGIISITYMAFILRTSILGLEYTYNRRTGQELSALVKYDKPKCEAELRKMMSDYDDYFKGRKAK